MEYIISIDGGGTKTRGIAAGLTGQIAADITGPGCNHQHVTPKRTKEVLSQIYTSLIRLLPKDHTILYIYLGLSGADTASDFEILNGIAQDIFGTIPFKIVNDTWLILRSGLKQNRGAAAICGTGTNSAAMDESGNTAILRALSYETGSFGGGTDMAREALFNAFRATELSAPPTTLTTSIPALFHVDCLEDLIPQLYPQMLFSEQELAQITHCIFEGAGQGDSVCREIITRTAALIGNQTAGVICQLGMEHTSIDVVIGGGIFEAGNDSFLHAFKAALLDRVPAARLVSPQFPPVIGGFLLALDLIGLPQTSEIESNLRASLSTAS